MSVLILKNVANEGPGTIQDFLEKNAIPYEIVEMYDCRTEVPDVRRHSHLVVMGGPMAVYEMDAHPYLSMESAIIRAFILARKPVLGICLGAQLIAHALGAEVYPGGRQELGWYSVDLTPDGMNDPVMSSLSVDGNAVAEVFQWHGDTFKLPAKAVRLATSTDFENQAFRYGKNVYALQFHIEVTPDIIREWFDGREDIDCSVMVDQALSIYGQYSARAEKFYERFFS
jgi:GMP synthase-like glutamine amidotransferase